MDDRSAAPLWIGAIGLAAAAAIGAYSGAVLRVGAGELSPIVGPHLRVSPSRWAADDRVSARSTVVADVRIGSANGLPKAAEPAS
jgi:hypothetical protein